MAKKKKAGAISAGGVGALLSLLRAAIPMGLVACLFLPWTVVSCGEVELGTQDGLQLLAAEITPSEELEELRRESEPSSDRGDDLPAEEWGMLGYLLGLALALLGGLGALGSGRSASRRLQGLGGLLMVAVLGFLLAFGFASERSIEAKIAEAEEEAAGADNGLADLGAAMTKDILGQFEFERDQGFDASLGLVVLLLLVCAVDRAVRPAE